MRYQFQDTVKTSYRLSVKIFLHQLTISYYHSKIIIYLVFRHGQTATYHFLNVHELANDYTKSCITSFPTTHYKLLSSCRVSQLSVLQPSQLSEVLNYRTLLDVHLTLSSQASLSEHILVKFDIPHRITSNLQSS